MIGRWFVLSCARVLGGERGLGGNDAGFGGRGFDGTALDCRMSTANTVVVALCYGNVNLASMTGCCVLFLEIVAGDIAKIITAIRTFIQVKPYFHVITLGISRRGSRYTH